MSQPKVYEFAKEVGLETIALMDKIKAWKLPVKSHMSALDEDTMAAILDNLAKEQESTEPAKKKKAKKKAAAKKKTTAKKKTAKKATTAKKKTKKKVTTTVVKKATTKAAEEEAPKKKVVKKTASKSTVIRRKAAHAPKTEEELAAEAAAAEAELAAKEAAAAEATAEEVSEVTAEASTAAEQTTEASSSESTAVEAKPEKVVKKRNIVGKIDLSKVRGPSGSQNNNNNSQERSPRPSATGPRNIRAGFIAPPPMMGDAKAQEEERRAREEKAKKKGGGFNREEVNAFNSSDFRKREVIFQPKKKRVLTNYSDSKKTQITTPKASKRVVKVEGTMAVSTLAQELGVKVPQLTKKLMGEGVMANMNTTLDFETISLIVPEFNFEAVNVHKTVDDLIDNLAFGDVEADPVSRPPVVTVMGHVDHGKTTLLDSIRKADVAGGEAGGITQHIGAYKVQLEDGSVVTFLDTPGHAAFTAMRARGANATDVAIIVVAADDGMMPQTEEAVRHAQAAEVPIIVAMNKMDRPNANPDKIKQQLAELELVPEDWGGSTIFCPVSALKGEGVKELLEQIHLVAEMQELKANPQRSATGVVIESKLEKGRGNVATVLIQDGTLKIGDYFVAGTISGRVRNMTNDQRKNVKEAIPGDPIELTGLSGTPSAGDKFDACKDEKAANEVSEKRIAQAEKAATPNSKMSLEELFSKVNTGDLAELPVIVKSDVAGTNEAIKGAFEKVGTEEVKVKVIHSGVGGVTESDVLLASTSGAIIVAFNTRPDTAAQRVAKEKGVEVKTYNVIYNLLDDIKKAMSGLLKPDIVEKVQGSAEIRDTFSVPKIGTIAGCFVIDGKISRSDSLRLVREGRVVYEGKISSLKRFKDDAKEVASGYECGIGIENYNDLKVGDVIEAFVQEEVARELQ